MILGLLTALMLTLHAGVEAPSFGSGSIGGQTLLQADADGDDEPADRPAGAAAICSIDSADCPALSFVSAIAARTHPTIAIDETPHPNIPAKWERPPDGSALT